MTRDADLCGQVILGRYRLEQKLGEGGYGAVYRALHLQMQSQVAVKVLHGEHSASEQVQRRFELEARRSATLRHPNTINVFDCGSSEDGLLFIAMELLQGRSLSTALAQDGAFAPERVAHVLDQTLSALSDAHEKGLVHRDLKPDNIFLTRVGRDADFVKVLDFGIAKALHASSEITASGAIIGTPAYMSPEQCRGLALDGRSDIYSVGCVAHHLLTGSAPFRSDSTVGYLLAHVQDPIPALPETVPAGLAAWVRTCLAKSCDDRFASAEDAREALAEALTGRAEHAPRVARSQARAPATPGATAGKRQASADFETAQATQPERPRRTRPWMLLALGVATVGVAVAIVLSLSNTAPTASAEPTIVTPPPSVSTTLAATPTLAPPVPAERAPPTAPAPATTAPEPAPAATAPEPARLRVLLTSVPDSEVLIDGVLRGRTPFEHTWEAGASPGKVRLEAAGYVSRDLTVTASDAGTTLATTLAATPVAANRRARTTSPPAAPARVTTTPSTGSTSDEPARGANDAPILR